MDYYIFALWVNLMIFILVWVVGAYHALQQKLEDLKVDKL